MAKTRHTESRTMSEEILDRAGEQPPHETGTPVPGATGEGMPVHPPHDPVTPPGVRRRTSPRRTGEGPPDPPAAG